MFHPILLMFDIIIINVNNKVLHTYICIVYIGAWSTKPVVLVTDLCIVTKVYTYVTKETILYQPHQFPQYLE